MHKGKDERSLEIKFGRLMNTDFVSLGGKPKFKISDYGKGLDKSIQFMKKRKTDTPNINGIETYGNEEFNVAAREQKKRSRDFGI